MADRYLVEQDVYGAIGANVVRSQLSGSGISLTAIIEGCTAGLIGRLRGSGYTAPRTSDPNTITELQLKEACMALVRIKLYTSFPDKILPLPDNWDYHPEMLALNNLSSKHEAEKGDALLDLPLSSVGSIGGATFTSVSTDPSRRPRASSCELWWW